MHCPFVRGTLQQFREECERQVGAFALAFRPDLRRNKKIEGCRFRELVDPL
jgi:hypothetical protein